jgi:hypothetical protein
MQAVYHMPTSEDADPETSMPLALQSVFYKVGGVFVSVCAYMCVGGWCVGGGGCVDTRSPLLPTLLRLALL